MKKHYLFLITLIMAFATYGQTNFRILDKLGDNITIATDNFCQSNTLGRLKLNVVGNTNFLMNPGTIIFISNNFVGGYYIVIGGRQGSNQDADETISSTTITDVSIICPIDTDGDGIQNSQDQCPTVAGPASNNGCPLFVQPKFQLTLAKLIQNNQSWNIFNNEKPTLNANPYSNRTPTTTFDFTFNTNNGTTSPNLRGDIKIYISNRSVLGTGNNIWVKELYQNYINYTPNDEIKITPSLTIPAIVNTPNGTYVMQDEETYYLHLVMYEIINFTQNRYVFPFKLNRLDVTSKSIDFSNTEISPSYNIEVFDLYGRKIFTKETKSKVEENNITLDLPKGIYIIKSKNGDRKVFVD